MPEKRIVLKNCGVINPKDITTYIANEGFRALQKARNEMTPEKVIDELKASGLRGRGGAGFPVGLKLEGARNAGGSERYVICNADEGEVGTFKDRYILQNDPFTLVEGIALASYAVGTDQAFIYLRAEYHYLLDQLLSAIDQAKRKGFLGNLDITVREGAGAYVCGEEMALMESIEGGRGDVRYKPPFPTVAGLWQKPTTINNVETMMNLPQIILNGAAWFNQIGTDRSKGTKVFSLSGDVARPGVYEMVFGSPLRELVVDLGGAEDVKLVQMGSTGRIVPAKNLDTPLSFEGVLGAGAVTVYNETRDVVDIVHRTEEFLAEESCGKCFPCREGTTNIAEIMGRFARNEGKAKDLELIEELSKAMTLASSCGLGQAAPIPVLDGLQHFRSEFESRIRAG